MAIETDPGSLDPQLTLLGAARTVNSFVYDPLLTVVGPGKVASGLASSWKVRSAKQVQLTLRRGVTCSDGTRMTASVVKRNIEFVGNPANGSPWYGVAVPPTATVEANDRAGTVTITSKIPSPFMLQGLGLLQIVCARGLADRSVLARGGAGSGPYILVESVTGDHYTFAVRKGYTWGPNGATTTAARLPARVVLKVVPNETTSANLLLTGGLNVATISGDERARLNSRDLFTRVTIGLPLEFFLNQKAGRPLADARVRRAVVQALNLNQIGGVADLRPRPSDDPAHEAGRVTLCRKLGGGQRPALQPTGGQVRPRREFAVAEGHLPDRCGRQPHAGDGARPAAAFAGGREDHVAGDDDRRPAGCAVCHGRLGHRGTGPRRDEPGAAEAVLLEALPR